MARGASNAARSSRQTAAEPEAVVQERTYRSESVYLCLLVNARTGFVRAIDFRSGPLPAKRLFIQSVARETGARKVITLVEKDEVSTWTRLGFVREGQIPGFYKRSDGHLCGCVVDAETQQIQARSVDEAAQRLAERTVTAARKLAKELTARPRFDFEEVEPEEALALRDEAWAAGEALGSFDPFGRDAARRFWRVRPKAKGEPLLLSAEYQECFGHALVEVLRSPRTPGETASLAAGLRKVHEALGERGIVSFFTFAPHDDVELGAAFAAAGYRRTGLLAGALPGREGRRDAILWSVKVAAPEE